MQKAVQELPPRSRPKYLLSADDSRDHLTLFALTFVAGFAADRPRFFGAGAGASAGSVSAVAAALLPVLLSPGILGFGIRLDPILLLVLLVLSQMHPEFSRRFGYGRLY